MERLGEAVRGELARFGPMAAIGDLAIDDCRLAALQFMQLCQGPTFMPFLFQAAPAPSAERTAEIVDSATRIGGASARTSTTRRSG